LPRDSIPGAVCHVVGIDLLPFASVHSDTFSYHAVDLERDFAQLNGIVGLVPLM
jgi:hypothetical protein